VSKIVNRTLEFFETFAQPAFVQLLGACPSRRCARSAGW
jgi:hypothetical protein